MSNIAEVHSKSIPLWCLCADGPLSRARARAEGVQRELHVVSCLRRCIDIILPNGAFAVGAAAGAETIGPLHRTNKTGACQNIEDISVDRFHRTGLQAGLVCTGVAWRQASGVPVS